MNCASAFGKLQQPGCGIKSGNSTKWSWPDGSSSITIGSPARHHSAALGFYLSHDCCMTAAFHWDLPNVNIFSLPIHPRFVRKMYLSWIFEPGARMANSSDSSCGVLSALPSTAAITNPGCKSTDSAALPGRSWFAHNRRRSQPQHAPSLIARASV